jgi:hypothetical protein
LFGDGHLVWRHVLVLAFPGSGIKEPKTRGVPTTASALPCEGDHYLHLAVKLKWCVMGVFTKRDDGIVGRCD